MILVTGATGFLGSELVKQLLAKGKNVRAIKRSNSKIPEILKYSNIEWVDADILDFFALQDAFEGIEQVYHCAAIVSFDPGDRKKMMRVNVEGTSNMVNLANQNRCRFLQVSSVAALGESKKGELITEEHYWELNKNQSNYSISKFQGEMEVHRSIAEGLDAIIVNPSVIIGANAGVQGSGRLFKLVKRGLNYYTSGSCGFVDVEDVVKCMIALMDSNISNQRFIINAENRDFKSLFTEIALGFGLPAPKIPLKSWMLNTGVILAKVATGLTRKSFGINSETARSAMTTQNFSSEKIKQAIRIEFKPLSISIAEICKTYKND